MTVAGAEALDWPTAGLSIRRIDDYTTMRMLQLGHSADSTYQTGSSVWNLSLVDNVGSKTTSDANTDLNINGPGDLILQPAGNVGIGTTSPSQKLTLRYDSSVVDGLGFEDTRSGYARNWKIGAGVGSGNYFSIYDTTAGRNDLKFDTTGYATFAASHNDLAENYLLNGAAKRGEIIGFDPQNKIQVGLANSNQSIMGVISTKPGAVMDATGGFTIGGDTKENYANEKVPVAAVGSVPVIVIGKPGSIVNGDAIALSTIPGVGAKATTAGKIVGNALEANNNWNAQSCPTVTSLDSITWPEDDSNNSLHPCFQLSDGTYVGKIMVFLNIGWNDPQVQLTDTGNLNLVDNTATADAKFTIPHYFTLNDVLGNPLQRVGEFSDAAIANLRAGIVNAQQVTTNALSVATENVTIGGQSLRNYIASIVSEIINQQSLINNQGFISPIASADEIHTNFISPLADDSNIAVSLHNSKFMILNSNNATGSAVATIDNQGNASFSGQLSSNSLNTNDATISGTLHAGRILASDIEGLNVTAATVSAQYITNVTNNIYNSTASAGTSNFGLIADQASPNTNSQSSMVNGQYIDIASFSGQFAYVENLSAANAAFSQNLMVFGQTSLSDTSIVGQLSVNGSLILANNSVNVLGSDLNLQPLRQGGLSIMGGLVYFDTDGNLKLGGNAEFAKNVTVKGNLAAGTISPLAGNDLNVNLPSNQNIDQIHNSEFIIHNSSSSAVLAINQLGDLIASGAGTFSKLNLSLAQPALAVSPTELVATGSAGTAQITPYQTQVTIDNASVTAKSLIYVTPVGTTFGQSVYLLRQTPDDSLNNEQGSFTVGITTPVPSAIKFNFLIVN
jgi:hypothetical protein